MRLASTSKAVGALRAPKSMGRNLSVRRARGVNESVRTRRKSHLSDASISGCSKSKRRAGFGEMGAFANALLDGGGSITQLGSSGSYCQCGRVRWVEVSRRSVQGARGHVADCRGLTSSRLAYTVSSSNGKDKGGLSQDGVADEITRSRSTTSSSLTAMTSTTPSPPSTAPALVQRPWLYALCSGTASPAGEPVFPRVARPTNPNQHRHVAPHSPVGA